MLSTFLNTLDLRQEVLGRFLNPAVFVHPSLNLPCSPTLVLMFITGSVCGVQVSPVRSAQHNNKKMLHQSTATASMTQNM